MGGETTADPATWQPAGYYERYVGAVSALNAPDQGKPPWIGWVDPDATAREVTAYNSVEWQTDDTPCEAADGSDICARHAAGERICAANWAPLGSTLRIQSDPRYQVDFTCTVADRMARRYRHAVDVYLGDDVDAARRFGRQILFVTLTHDHE